MPNHPDDILSQFEQLSRQLTPMLKDLPEFKEAETIYLQLKDTWVKLIESEQMRIENHSREGLY